MLITKIFFWNESDKRVISLRILLVKFAEKFIRLWKWLI